MVVYSGLPQETARVTHGYARLHCVISRLAAVSLYKRNAQPLAKFVISFVRQRSTMTLSLSLSLSLVFCCCQQIYDILTLQPALCLELLVLLPCNVCFPATKLSV